MDNNKRFVSIREQKQRGCIYCLHKRMVKREDAPDAKARKSQRLLSCPFDKCPFHILDGIKNYITEYDKPIEMKMPKLVVKTR